MHLCSLKRKAIAVPTPHLRVAHTTTVKSVPTLVKPAIVHTVSTRTVQVLVTVQSVLVAVPTTISVIASIFVPTNTILVALMQVTSTSPAVVSASPTSLASRGKAVLLLYDVLPFLTTFEIGSSSHPVTLIRTQRWNRRKHTKHTLERLEVVVPVVEDVPLTQVSRLPVKNRFHPLPNTDWEDNVRRIAVALPPPAVCLSPTTIRRPPISWFRTVLRSIGRETGRSETDVLQDLGAIVPKRIQAHIHEEQST